MKKFFATKLAVALLVMWGVHTIEAATATIDGITWNYILNGTKAIIGTNTRRPAIDASTEGAITIPTSLSGCPVTDIGDYAFADCRNITHITIPEGVISIGEGAFSECNSLNKVKIPNSVQSIGSASFYNCTSLEEVIIPDSTVNYISIDAFQEIKYRLGYREKITIEQFNEIEKVAEDVKRRYNQVTMSTVNRYWEYVRKEK